MQIIVLGAGVIGVTTAYYLVQDGHDVTVIDRANHVAAGASHANGGQLSYSFTDAFANPAFLAQLPRFALGLDPAVRIRKLYSPKLLRWAFGFLRQCTSGRAHDNSMAALSLALRSASMLADLMEQVPLSFSFRQAGKIVLVRNHKVLAGAVRNCEIKKQYGCDSKVIRMNEVHQLEPAIANMKANYAGAIYAQNDEVADARAFTEGLATWLKSEHRVRFKLGVHVEALARQGQTVVGVHTEHGLEAADAVVVCAGAWSNSLLAPLGVNANIYPLRGYSVTLPPGKHSPRINVTDYERKIVFSRFDHHVRIAGFADFVGYNKKHDLERVKTLLNVSQQVAPLAALYDDPANQGWGGFRPMTPDGRPRIGSTRVKNLFLNTGHGMLGWTMACASGYDLAHAVKREHSTGS